MQKFEYLKIEKEWFRGIDETELQELGSYSWELCGVSVEYNSEGIKRNVFYFKRSIMG